MTQITLPDLATMQPRTPVPSRVTARRMPEAEVSLAGTRSGWAMRTVYLLSDLAAFAISLLLAKLAVDIVSGVRLGSIQLIELKLFALWMIGLVAVAVAQQAYAAIPPRPVRKFRGWVLGALMVCMAVIGGAWLLEVETVASFFTISIASGLAVLLASFCRAICRISFGSARWWGTRLIVVGKGELAAKAFA